MKRTGVGFIVNGELKPVSGVAYKRAMSAFDEGTKVTWTIESYRREKSLGQLNLFHLLVRKISEEIGEDERDLKDWFKRNYGVWAEMTDKNGVPIVDEYTGEISMKVVSLADYNTEQAAKLIDSIYRFAAEHNIALPNPDDLRNNNIKW